MRRPPHGQQPAIGQVPPRVLPADVVPGPPRLPDPPSGPWRVTVTQCGRFRWKIDVTRGAYRYGWGFEGIVGPYHAWGSRDHALAKARRLKARWQRRIEREELRKAERIEL